MEAASRVRNKVVMALMLINLFSRESELISNNDRPSSLSEVLRVRSQAIRPRCYLTELIFPVQGI